MTIKGCAYHKWSFADRKIGPQPNPCDCMSCVQRQRSLQISNNHITGQWCVESNYCSYCMFLRHLLRIIRHFSGNHSARACPICRGQISKFFTFRSILRQVYYMMLANGPINYSKMYRIKRT
jgi:hypothetical protein